MYPQQSRCDVTTSQQIGTLSRSARDFSPEFCWAFWTFWNFAVVSWYLFLNRVSSFFWTTSRTTDQSREAKVTPSWIHVVYFCHYRLFLRLWSIHNSYNIPLGAGASAGGPKARKCEDFQRGLNNNQKQNQFFEGTFSVGLFPAIYRHVSKSLFSV